MKYNKTFREALKEVSKLKEDGHTDVASAIRKCKTTIEDASQLLSKLQGMDPEGGVTASYISMEQLNDDYVDFEIEYFRERHKGYKYWWDFSEILDRSENAYKPITHSIFEINKEGGENGDESFIDKMMTKYGIASRKMHGWLQVELVMAK